MKLLPIIIFVACQLSQLILVSTAWTQVLGTGRQLPNANYYLPFRQFYQADFRSAGQEFNRGAVSAYKFGTQRYLDSICFWTMSGECSYHLGQYADAISMYEQALDLYLYYQNVQWQTRLQMPNVIPADNTIANRVQISWGTSSRNPRLPRMPESFNIMFGRLDAERAFQEGGVVQNAELRQIDLNEIMRCTALALHHRRVIKGPTSQYDPFTTKLVNGLRAGAIGDGTLIGAYNGVLLGIAEASMEEWESAARTLNRSLSFNGGMDHPLTPIALLELANIALETENAAVAGPLALEASYSAAYFYQYDLVEEALSLATQIHLLNNPSPFPPLPNAIAWADRERAVSLQASLLTRLAECHAEAGDAKAAGNVLSQAAGMINNRNDLGISTIASRLKYLSALLRFLNADFANGMVDLNAALAQFRTGSLWLYRLQLSDQLVLNNVIGERQSDLLYGSLLHDPTDLQWQLDPLEAMAFLASDHVGPMERWFDIVVNRKDMDRAINIAELVRRHRFYASLPLGGRLLAFRWVMHGPDALMTPKASTQRQKFLGRQTQYQQWSARANEIHTQLLTLPLQPAQESEEARLQQKLLDELGKLSNLQEATLASFALRREPAEMVFPPQRNLKEFQALLAKDQIALVTLATNRGYHAFLVDAASVQYLGLNQARNVVRGVGSLLKELGVVDAAVDADVLSSDQWKDVAKKLGTFLFKNSSPQSWTGKRELLIVPDGALWYLPFELLTVDAVDPSASLRDKLTIRYSPLLFLGYASTQPERELKRKAVVVAPMNPRLKQDISLQAFDEFAKQVPDATKFDRPLKGSSNLMISLIDQLTIFSDLQSKHGVNPLELNPWHLDQGQVGSTLLDWIQLPPFGVEQIVLPGFNSAGSVGFRSSANGSEMFLTTTGMLAAGANTVLISRWSAGGANSLALSRMFCERSIDEHPLKALQESIALARVLFFNQTI